MVFEAAIKMRRAPLTNLRNMIKIKKGVDPVGSSFHIASIADGGKITWHRYNVSSVTGNGNHIPTGDTVVHLEYDFSVRSGNACAPALSYPLSVFVERTKGEKPRIMPAELKDVFWE